MEIAGLSLFIILPGTSSEEACPVVGSSWPGIGPIVIIFIWLDSSPALLEPFMLRGSVVYYKIHNDLYAPLVSFGNKRVEVGHGTEVRMNGIIVADIISIVFIGRGIYRTKPYYIHSQGRNIIQL